MMLIVLFSKYIIVNSPVEVIHVAGGWPHDSVANRALYNRAISSVEIITKKKQEKPKMNPCSCSTVSFFLFSFTFLGLLRLGESSRYKKLLVSYLYFSATAKKTAPANAVALSNVVRYEPLADQNEAIKKNINHALFE